MLLAQPFEPFDNEQTQLKKMPFLARCKVLSQRTKRALYSLKNRTHATTRNYPTVMLPDNRFILTAPQPQPQPQPQPWYSAYGGCYDPYFMLAPPLPQPMHFPPMPSHQSMPYSICVHLTTSCPFETCHDRPRRKNKSRKYQQQTHESSSSTGSTLCNSTLSLFNDDEKEQIECDSLNDDSTLHVERRRSLNSIAPTASTLSRSNSDIRHNRNQHCQQRRSYMQQRSNSQNDMYYYYD